MLLAHGDEQVLPIIAAPFTIFLGFDRSSSGISKQQIELFAIEIPDSDTKKDSPPPPPLLKQKLNPHVVMDLPQSIFIAALGSSVYCFGNVEAFDVSCPTAASFFRRCRLVIWSSSGMSLSRFQVLSIQSEPII